MPFIRLQLKLFTKVTTSQNLIETSIFRKKQLIFNELSFHINDITKFCRKKVGTPHHIPLIRWKP